MFLVGGQALDFCKAPRGKIDCNRCYINKVEQNWIECPTTPSIWLNFPKKRQNESIKWGRLLDGWTDGWMDALMIAQSGLLRWWSTCNLSSVPTKLDASAWSRQDQQHPVQRTGLSQHPLRGSFFGFFAGSSSALPPDSSSVSPPVIKLSTDGAHPEGRCVLSFGWDGVSPVKYVWGPWAQQTRELLPFSVLFPPLYSSPSHFLHVKCRKAAGSHFASPPSVKPHDSHTHTHARTDTPLHATYSINPM